jgi:2-keto-4-pentenoate hydratase
MTPDQIQRTAERLVEARRKGTRLPLAAAELPATFADALAVQDKVVAALASPVAGWKVNELPGGEVIFAPILQSGVVAPGGTWALAGREPAGVELEIAFRMGSDVPDGASPAAILDAVATAHVVFELCESRLANPDAHTQAAKLADCILNSGIVIGPSFAGWRDRELKAVPGRLVVDGQVIKEGKSVDPIRALQVLPAALAKAGKRLAKGQTVITGSLIGMNWLTGRRAVRGVIDGCGEVAITVAAA